jgi:hypothetical protein
MSHKSKKPKPFCQLPKHKRKDYVFYLKNNIKKYKSIFGGEFSSYLMPDDEEDFNAQSFPVCFLGTDPYTFWNANIGTAKSAFADELDSLVYKQVRPMLTDEEFEASFSIRLQPTEEKRTFTVINQDPMKHEKFGGLTYEEKCEQLRLEIIENNPPKIYEIFEHDYKYQSGIGLRIIANVDGINRAIIRELIEKFRSLGEANWKSSQAIPVENLTPIIKNQFDDFAFL